MTLTRETVKGAALGASAVFALWGLVTVVHGWRNLEALVVQMEQTFALMRTEPDGHIVLRGAPMLPPTAPWATPTPAPATPPASPPATAPPPPPAATP